MTNKTLKFLIGAAGIYGSFVMYGIYQEKLFKTQYPNIDNQQDVQKFTNAFIILLLQSIISTIIGFTEVKLAGERIIVPKSVQFKSGLFNSFSVLGGNTALQFVSYPVQALFKSCKVLSVLVIGFFFGSYKYRKLQYIAGGLVTAGILFFNLLTSKNSGQNTIFGILLLLISLFSDGMLANVQNDCRKIYKPSSSQLMYFTAFYSVIISLVYSIVTGQLFLFLNFIGKRPSVIPDLIIVCTLASIGQNFIFYTIKHFGPNNLAIITTTRKLFTVVCSILYYGHHVSEYQWVSILVVFSGVFVEYYDSQTHTSIHKTHQNGHQNGHSNSEQEEQQQLKNGNIPYHDGALQNNNEKELRNDKYIKQIDKKKSL